MSRKLLSVVLALAGAFVLSACGSGGSSSVQEYTLTYEAGEGGSIAGPAEQVVAAGEDGEPVTAEPGAGYHFVQWDDGVDTAERTETDVQEEVHVTAEFALNQYTLEYTAGPGGSIDGPTPQTVDHGEDGEPVTATADTGFHFVQWSDGIEAAERTDTDLQGDLAVTAEFAINQYSVSYSAGEGGSILGPTPQTVDHGDDAETVTAVPATGYHFVQWSDGLGTPERTELSIQGDVSVTAEFALNEYTLTYTAGEGGGIDGDTPQSVSHGSDGSTVTAVADTGYSFVQWSDGVTTAARTDTDVQGDLAVSAEFELNHYSLSYLAETGGSISGPASQTVAHGSDGEMVTAVPDSGYSFTQWSDGITTAERTDTGVQANLAVTAAFELNQYTLNYEAGEGGSISGPAEQAVDHGDDAGTVTAEPDEGYSFVQWSDGLETAERTDTDLQGDLSVTAEFELNEYTLTYSAETGGSITGETEQTVSHGSDASTVTAVADTGYTFVQWSDGVTASERTDTDVQGDLSVTAEFELNDYTLNYSAGAGGSITGESEQTVSHGSDASTVTAVADTGYSFAGWSDGVETPERTDTNVQGGFSVTAEFSLNEYSVTYSAGPGGSVSGPVDQTVSHGSDAESVTAEPDTGYHFVQWNDGVTTAERRDTDLQGDLSVTAEFELNEYTLNYSAGAGGSITGEAEQVVAYGSDGTTVTAEPDAGYSFVQWNDGVTTAERTDTGVDGDLSVTAIFELNEYTLNYSAGTGGSITGETEQTVSHGSDGSTVTAVADTGYHFVQWSDGVTTAERTDTEVQGDLSVTAEFELNEYTLTYSAAEGGSISGDAAQTVTHGEDGSTVTAEPDTGYVFVQWSDGLESAERSDTNIQADLSATAEFELIQYSLSYAAGEGGNITGEAEQTVNHGDDGSTVTAVADTGYSFVQWSDGVTTAERTDTSVQSDLTVTAQFELDQYSLTYTSDTVGSITGPASQTVSHGGDGETVTAVAETEGYVFVQWSDGLTTAERTDTDIQADLSVNAEFTLEEYSLTYTAGAGGSITGESGQTVLHGGDASTVTAVPDTGYSFVQWSDGVTTAERTDTGVDGDLSVTAEFELKEYTLNYSAGAGGSITGEAEQTVSHGSDGNTVTAVADTGYSFVQWSDGATTAERTDTDVQGDLSVTAEFELIQYSLSYAAGAGGSITGEAEQTVDHGDDGSTVTAVAEAGYTFSQWSDGVTTAERTDTGVDGDLSVTAEFELNEYSLEYSAGEGGAISGPSSQTVAHGEDGASVTAEPDAGYFFDRWSDGVATAERSDTDIQANLSVEAEFLPLLSIGGTVSGLDGDGLELALNGSEQTLVVNSGATTFTFDEPLQDGSSYEVTVITQPSGPAQECSVSQGSGTVSGSDVNDVAIDCEMATFMIRGTISGFDSDDGSMELSLNDWEQGLYISSAGTTAFEFPGPVEDGFEYEVSIFLPPDSVLDCTISNRIGTVSGANVEDIHIDCMTVYEIGGEVLDLEGHGLELALDVGDQVVEIAPDGSYYVPYTFPEPIPDGSSFEVTVATQPVAPEQVCSVQNGSGTVNGGGVLDVHVDCGASELWLKSRSGVMAVDLQWYGPDTVDILVSSDPDCDWGNIALCADNRSLLDVSDGEMTLAAVTEDLDADKDWYFVARDGSEYSNQVGARPYSFAFDGAVNTVVADEERVYVGGDFSGMSVPAGRGIIVDSLDGSLVAASLDIEGDGIYVVEPDGGGGWFIGGEFEAVDGFTRNNFARIRPDGSVDPDWESGVGVTSGWGVVQAITVDDGKVYVGGVFEDAGGMARQNLAAFDAETGNLDFDWQPGANGEVYDLLMHEDTLFVAGYFDAVDGEPVSNLAALNQDGSLKPGWDAGVDGMTSGLAVSGDTLYVGGWFNEANGEPRSHLAAFDVESGSLDADWRPNADGWVWDLAVVGNTVYLGGEFSQVGGGWSARLAAVSADTGTFDYSWEPPSINGWVHRLTIVGKRLYAAGRFDFGTSLPISNVAAFSLSDGAVDEGWDLEVDEGVSSVAVQHGQAFVGGDFRSMMWKRRSNLAAFDADTGTLSEAWAPRANGQVNTLLHIGDAIYAGGSFTRINGALVNRLALLDVDDGAPETSWSAGISNGQVNDMVHADGRLHVGGNFPANTFIGYGAHLAAFDAITGSVLSGWDDAPDAPVDAVVTAGGQLFAGGYFQNVGSTNQALLAAFDAASGAFDPDWNPVITATGAPRVRALEVISDTLYVGGNFSGVNGETRAGAAAFAVDDAALLGWDPDDTATIYVLKAHEGELYAGGSANDAWRRLMRLDVLTGDRDTSWDAGVEDPLDEGGITRVIGIEVTDDRVYAGGWFTGAQGVKRLRFAVFDTDTGELLW